MTDEQLKTMTKDEANKTLSYEDKVRWAELLTKQHERKDI